MPKTVTFALTNAKTCLRHLNILPFKGQMVVLSMHILLSTIFLLGFTPCKAELPLQRMALQKKHKKIQAYRKSL